MIDFGKATLVKKPLVYNIDPNSDRSAKYNKVHRHLAYELRNFRNTKQSFNTDAFSIGYMFKHAAAVIPYSPIIELGRLLKDRNVLLRISVDNALDKMKYM